EKKLRHLSSGQLVRVAKDGKVEFESFKALQQYSWSAPYSYSWLDDTKNTCRVSDQTGKSLDLYRKSDALSPKLEEALEELERQKAGTVKAWKDGEWVTYDSQEHAMADAWIRCGCCDEYVDPLSTEEAFGELVCD